MKDKSNLFFKFIEKSYKIHAKKYSYEKSNYQTSKVKIEIICPSHGSFYQTPDNHSRGQGCPKCKSEKLSLIKKITQEEFLYKIQQVHNDKYDYSMLKYNGYHFPITIICKKHGPFTQKANNHLYGSGCPKCGINTIATSIIEKDGKIYKICSICKIPKECNITNFYRRSRGDLNSYCKICDIKMMVERIKKLKSKLVEYKGGKCKICGYNKCNRSLDFHHINPDKKDFNISDRKTNKFEKLKKEVDKCILLCSNCHGEFHDGILTI